MSWQATNAVAKHSKSKGSARLLLITIANYVGVDGAPVHEKLEAFVEDTLLSERTIRNLVQTLERLGELEVVRAKGHGVANSYRILLPGITPERGERNRQKL